MKNTFIFALILSIILSACVVTPETPTIEPPTKTSLPTKVTPDLKTTSTFVSSDTREELQSVSLVITNGTIVDGTGADPITDGLVAIHDNRIVAIGQSDDFKIPDEAVLIDAEDGTILPGIINSHSHFDSGAATRRIMFLLDGVTSVCDMMISMQMMSYLEEERTQEGPAARGFKAGPIVTAPGGYPGIIFGTYNSYEIQGEDEAENAVLDLHTRRADYKNLFIRSFPFES